jgi:glycosyltransferase involved in cell wall biosynthesis
MDVSVIVTAYNYAAYLPECLDSCLAQECPGLAFEVVVVDDGSTDATPELLARTHHMRLRKYRIPNSGIERASNFGFEQAGGRMLVRVDADDRLRPGYLQALREGLADGAGFCYPDYAVIDQHGAVTGQVQLPDFDAAEIRARGDFLATGTLFDARVLREAGAYDTTWRNSGLENYELMLRLLQAGVRGRHVGQCLFDYRRHAANISATKKEEIIANGRALFDRMGLGRYGSNAFHPYQLKVDAA